MASYFRTNHAGWRRLAKGREGQAAADMGAYRVLANAKPIAPVLTGRYRDTLHVEQDDTGPTAQSTVGSPVPYATTIEAHNNVLGRALHP